MTDFVAPIMARYRNYNINGEPSPEIISLDYAPFESSADGIPAAARLVLVLVEPRVLEPISGLGPDDDLAGRLLRFKGDLRAEGYHSRFILANVYRGDINQDGRTVIALRRFLREVKAAHPNLEGVVMVGAFPEAALVRRWVWAPAFEQQIMGLLRTGRYLSAYPELVDTRTDIILSDLTGNWEALYHESGLHVPGIIAYPDEATAAQPWADVEFVRAGDFTSDVFRIDDVVFRDVFYVDDASVTIIERRDLPAPYPLLRLHVEGGLRNPEISADDRARPNQIARPDICVSRINALNVAVDPDPTKRGADGRTFLDANGNPQTVRSAEDILPADQYTCFTCRNPVLERRLYCRYFDLNHRFRVGAFGNQPFRVGSISGTAEFDPNYYAGILNTASNSFAPALVVPNANLADYVNFYREPSVLRHMIAHSSMFNSGFRDTATPEQIAAAVGGDPIFWFKYGDEYRPSYEGLNGCADLFIHRAMWHNKTLRNAGAAIVIHAGCEVNAAYGTSDVPYQSPRYAIWQNAEGILFFTNTVALLARAKVFNDDPWGFPDGFRTNDRANVGTAFKNFYEAQSQDAGLQNEYAQNKRTYNWSLNGDWTVRLRNKNGLGILRLSDEGIVADHVHPDRAWVGDWNFDRALNSLVCIGDVNGDGRDEFVVRSEWGVGLLRHDGRRWQSLLAAPRDTWFGGWRYDATVNAGRDRIVGAADLTGTGASEILVTSSWGLGCLGWTGAGLSTSFILQNGGRIGGWLLSTADNKFEGFGNFDSTTQKELLVTSPWGLGILSLQSNTSPVMVANNTVLPGGWKFNTAENSIAAVADFDGDGRDEILIKGPSGIAVLKVQGNALVTVALHPYGAVLGGGYTVQNGDRLWATGNFLGGATRQAAFAQNSGLSLLRLQGNSLVKAAGLNDSQRIGGWLFSTYDNRCAAVTDFDGNGRAEMFLSNRGGVGIIGFGEGGTYVNLAAHVYGNTLGDWCLESTDTFFGSGKLLGNGARYEVLVKK